MQEMAAAGELVIRSMVKASSSSARSSKSRSPRPSSTGATARCISSTRPALRYWRTVEAPPPMRTACSPEAARARSSAASMPSVTKWKVVPPCISIGSRGWCVSTNTGWWYGGSSPHQPVQSSLPQGPRTGPNMFRPMMCAPTPWTPRAARSSSGPVAPPSMPSSCRNVRVAKAQSCRRSPPIPSGCSSLWPGPATNPSRDTDRLLTRTFDMSAPSQRTVPPFYARAPGSRPAA